MKGRKNKKLSIPQAREVKQLIANGHSDDVVAQRFGIHRRTVSDMRRGKYRIYIPMPPPQLEPA